VSLLDRDGGGEKGERETDVDVPVYDFVGICFGDEDAVYRGGCVGHFGGSCCGFKKLVGWL
jgi:hypothetical protein